MELATIKLTRASLRSATYPARSHPIRRYVTSPPRCLSGDPYTLYEKFIFPGKCILTSLLTISSWNYIMKINFIYINSVDDNRVQI